MTAPKELIARREAVIKAIADARAAGQTPNLAGWDLSHLPLACIDFSGVNLDGALLNKSNLADCTFTGASMVRVRAYGAGFAFARFTNADMRGALIYKADLGYTDFTGANLAAATIGSTSVLGTDLSAAAHAPGATARLYAPTFTDDKPRTQAVHADLYETLVA